MTATAQSLQRGVPVAIGAFTANGNLAAPVAIPMDWGPGEGIIIQFNVAGGTLTSIKVAAQLSLDGVNFNQTHGSSTQVTGDCFQAVDTSTGTNPMKAPYLNINVSNLVVNTGNPVVTVIAMFR